MADVLSDVSALDAEDTVISNVQNWYIPDADEWKWMGFFDAYTPSLEDKYWRVGTMAPDSYALALYMLGTDPEFLIHRDEKGKEEAASTILFLEDTRTLSEKMKAKYGKERTQKFTCFPKLPYDCRYLIWKAAIVQPRLIRVSVGDPGDEEHVHVQPRHAPLHHRNPAVLRVCQESRYIALQHLKYVKSFNAFVNTGIDTIQVLPLQMMMPRLRFENFTVCPHLFTTIDEYRIIRNLRFLSIDWQALRSFRYTPEAGEKLDKGDVRGFKALVAQFRKLEYLVIYCDTKAPQYVFPGRPLLLDTDSHDGFDEVTKADLEREIQELQDEAKVFGVNWYAPKVMVAIM